MDTEFIKSYAVFLAAIAGVFAVILLLSKHVSTRKLMHITIGPVFLLFCLRNQPRDLPEKLLYALVPLTSAIVFGLSKLLKSLQFVEKMITRNEKTQIIGVIIYGIAFAVFPFWPSRHLLAGLICLALGDGFSGYGALVSKKLRIPVQPDSKTITGTVIFVLAAACGMVCYGFGLAQSVVTALCCALVERVFSLSDNLFIILTGILVTFLFDTEFKTSE